MISTHFNELYFTDFVSFVEFTAVVEGKFTAVDESKFTVVVESKFTPVNYNKFTGCIFLNVNFAIIVWNLFKFYKKFPEAVNYGAVFTTLFFVTY